MIYIQTESCVLSGYSQELIVLLTPLDQMALWKVFFSIKKIHGCQHNGVHKDGKFIQIEKVKSENTWILLGNFCWTILGNY